MYRPRPHPSFMHISNGNKKHNNGGCLLPSIMILILIIGFANSATAGVFAILIDIIILILI